ncbi:hypothetical protein [Flectobacillus roseus]|uniref:Uncharacterized protein n=1 Tax=Flectobacillus roseus TaxID=502259 RepID=A0ABT6Y722_9BACT|nr:hypothetical protein [Flectobacillus roseus]MDI9859369.1 hypothetical protein [Flectobacillus roseus]
MPTTIAAMLASLTTHNAYEASIFMDGWDYFIFFKIKTFKVNEKNIPKTNYFL